MVRAANGVSLSAMKIFSITLRYFRDHAIQELRDATGTKIEHVSVREDCFMLSLGEMINDRRTSDG